MATTAPSGRRVRLTTLTRPVYHAGPGQTRPVAVQERSAELAGLVALRTPAGQELLADLPPYDPDSVLALADRLRGRHDPQLVSAALTQSRLRAAAARRVGPRANRMLWTADAAEQASRGSVAAWRADRLARAGVRQVLDLGAGAGVDSLALADAGLRVLAVEREAAAAEALAHNAGLAGGRVSVVRADAAQAAALLAGCDGLYADPARRSGGRRLHDPGRWSPPLDLVARLAALVPAAVVKAGPGIGHDRLPGDAQAEWVSEAGDVLECALWWGAARPGPARSATLLADPPRTLRGCGRDAGTRPVGRFLLEPDGAVIRAGLVAEVADLVAGGLLDPTIAFVTTDSQTRTPFASRYEVTEVLPFSVKRLRAALRARGAGPLTVKKRGSAVTPEALRAQLRLSGPNPATVVLTRVAGAPTALLVEPAP